MGYEALPRVRLANLPTPLEEAKRLRLAIGGPRLWIKRIRNIWKDKQYSHKNL